MSKLTGWINPITTQSLDINEIVDKYENELSANYINNNEATKHLPGQEVWSGSLEGSMFTTNINSHETVKLQNTSPLSKNTNNDAQTPLFDKLEQPTINTNVQQPKNIESKQEDKPFGLDEIKFQPTSIHATASIEQTSAEPKQENFVPKFEIPKFDINSAKGPKVPPPPIFKLEPKLENNESANKFEEIVKNSPVLNTAPQEPEDNKMVELNIANTKLFETPTESNKNKTSGFKTIRFQNTTNELNKEQKLVQPKIEENSFKLESENQNLSFVDKESYQKQLEETDLKTVKMQSAKIDTNESTSGLTTNLFTSKMTQVYFQETVKAEDLDLTKEVNDADAITIDASTEHKSKRKFSFFKKKKH